MVAALLAGDQPKAAPCVGVAHSGSAEVNDCGQILLLLESGSSDPLAPHRACDATMQQSRCQFDGVARNNASVEAIKPARSHVVPGTLLHHHMAVDAVSLRFAERSVRDLIHTDRARRRLIQLEGISC